MVHKGPLVDVILGLEYQHYDVGSKTAFCVTAACKTSTTMTWKPKATLFERA